METILNDIQSKLNASEHLLRLGRLFTATVQLRIDDNEYYLEFEKGRLVRCNAGPSRKTPWNFSIVTDREALDQFWQPLPKPDLFGLVKIGRARIDGDILLLVKNLRYFKEVLALPRQEVL